MFDWNDLKAFLAVARGGSNLAASKQLGVIQTTVARRIETLEHTLGLKLFERGQTGSRLTKPGEPLIPDAQAVERATTLMMRYAGGKPAITRSNSMTSLVYAVKAGLGIGAIPCTIADPDRDLIRCSEPITEARASSWIVTRRELKDTPRVRAFIDF